LYVRRYFRTGFSALMRSSANPTTALMHKRKPRNPVFLFDVRIDWPSGPFRFGIYSLASLRNLFVY
jgi:hypothetical protein